ncbi:MAG: hypothetical protein KGZ37_04985 [Nitrosarchaeum sp.]|nr:hypothetical protein [Nitrosarchaeum sp.]
MNAAEQLHTFAIELERVAAALLEVHHALSGFAVADSEMFLHTVEDLDANREAKDNDDDSNDAVCRGSFVGPLILDDLVQSHLLDFLHLAACCE